MDHIALPSALAELLTPDRLSPLGPGQPEEARRTQLAALSVDHALGPHPVRDQDMARACLAGLWLYHEFLDESHLLSQDLDTAEGSFWHGIMHRREPDFSNAKYWFRRVGRHPIFEPLRAEAAALARSETDKAAAEVGAFLVRQTIWDPFAFIDLCAAAINKRAPCEMLCRRIQACEWQLLFEYCYRRAVGVD